MAATRSPAELPWSERHRPKHLGQVVGNTNQVRKLAEWLRDWDDVVMHGKVKEVKEDPNEAWKKWKPAPENINAKAVLISGPPGIGKTTTVTLVAKCNKRYSLREFNASDVRNKKAIEALTQSLSGNHTLKLGAMFGTGSLERPVLIMDECDGMDAAGTTALIAMIKNTKSPIICICNDRQAQSVRALADSCLDIKFKRPENVLVARRIKNILEGEGAKVELSALEAVVEACAQDIRQVINQVQFFGVAGSHARGNQKDAQLMLSPFDACQKLLTKPSKSEKPVEMGAKMDMYYIDADMMPLMIQENYLKPSEKGNSSSNDDEHLEKAAYAAELIATGDSQSGDWGVQSSTAILGTIYPAFLTSRADFARPQFPMWLQKRSGITKANRVSHELHARLREKTTCSHRDLVTSGYHDVLYRRFMPSLASGDVKKCAGMLHSCGLTRDFFTEQAPVLRKALQLDDKYAQVDGRIRQQLLSELRLLQEAHNPVKRKIDAAAAGPAGKKAKKANAQCVSVGSWVKKKDTFDADGVLQKPEADKPKEPMLILKYIEGHTVAVRRKVHLKNLLVPWTDF